MFEQHTYTHNRDCGVDSCFASNIVPTGAKVILKLNFEIVCIWNAMPLQSHEINQKVQTF